MGDIAVDMSQGLGFMSASLLETRKKLKLRRLRGFVDRAFRTARPEERAIAKELLRKYAIKRGNPALRMLRFAKAFDGILKFGRPIGSEAIEIYFYLLNRCRLLRGTPSFSYFCFVFSV